MPASTASGMVGSVTVVAWYNPPALAFWRKVTEAAAPGKVEEIAGDGKRWAGPVLRFGTESTA